MLNIDEVKVYAPKLSMDMFNYFDLVPPDLQPMSVIAGGALVSNEGDVDLWILTPNEYFVSTPSYWTGIRNRVREYLERLKLPHPAFSNLIWKEREANGEEYASNGRVLFDVEAYPKAEHPGFFGGIPRKLQILGTSQHTATGLLNTFDLSVHQVAVRWDGITYTVPTSTTRSEIIRITNLHSPERTFKRYRKLWHRYEVFRGNLANGIDHQGILNLIRAPYDGAALAAQDEKIKELR